MNILKKKEGSGDIYFTEDDVGLFLCHSEKGKKLAGKLKKKLEKFGFKVFLAHEDIHGAKEFENVILENIKKCDVFCILLTADVRSSEWCDQEIGAAVSHKKIILPLKVNSIDPHGYVKRFHALKLDPDNIGFSTRGILDSLLHQNGLKWKSLNSLIDYFGESNTFEEAGLRTADLIKFAPFSEEQLNTIAQISIENNQIYQSWEAQKHLKQLFSDNQTKLKSNLVKNLKELKMI